jgi:hypothetical protein
MNSQTHHHQPLNDPPPMHVHMQAIPRSTRCSRTESTKHLGTDERQASHCAGISNPAKTKQQTPNVYFLLFFFQCFRVRLSHAHEYVSPERQRNAARMMLGIVNANMGSTLQKGNLAETFKCNAGKVGCRGKEEGFVM